MAAANLVLAWYVDGTPKPIPDAFFRDGGLERPEYIVTYDTRRSRRWQCTCPHNTYRHASCKHIERCKPDVPYWEDLFAWYRGEEAPSLARYLIRE